MTVKVSIPVDDTCALLADIMIHSSDDTYVCFMRRADNPKTYDKLVRLVQENGVCEPGTNQVTDAYFEAFLKNRDTLKIYTGVVLAPQPF